MSTVTYTVVGMTCEHCVASVTEEIQAINGVTSVRVDLATGAVTVTGSRPLAVGEIARAVDEAGYDLA
jgi:copper chaperone CopZ